jgi:hypothetical protein
LYTEANIVIWTGMRTFAKQIKPLGIVEKLSFSQVIDFKANNSDTINLG